MVSKEEKKVEKEIEKVLREAKRCAKKKDYEGAALLYKKVSLLAHKIRDKRAVEYALEAAKCNLKIENFFNAGWSYRNAALFSKDFGDFDNAVSFALKAVDYFSKTGSSYAIQWCYNIAGEASEEMKDYFSAAKYYRKSLEIERKAEIEKKLDDILKKVPHPVVEQVPDKEEVREGDTITFKIRIRNDSPEVLADICLLGEDGERICSAETIEPGDEKILCLEKKAEGVLLGSPIKKVKWKAKGGDFAEEIEQVEIPVKPNVEIKPYLKNKLRVGGYSYFVISVKNNSPSPITDVRLFVDFPLELKVKPVTGYRLEKILGNEEKGFVFKILPVTVGRTRIEPEIRFKNLEGLEYRERAGPFFLEEVLEPPKEMKIGEGHEETVSEKEMERIKMIQESKRYISSLMVPFEISEPEYIAMTKKLYHATKGCTLKGIDLDDVSKHVMEECKGAKLVGLHKFDNEMLFMFAGKSRKEDRIYLLTVVVKEENGLIHLAFRLYSDRKENLNELLSKIGEIIKHAIVVMSFATEIEKIEIKKIVNIIDSIVQRSDIGTGEGAEEDKEINVKDSVIQRTEL